MTKTTLEKIISKLKNVPLNKWKEVGKRLYTPCKYVPNHSCWYACNDRHGQGAGKHGFKTRLSQYQFEITMERESVLDNVALHAGDYEYEDSDSYSLHVKNRKGTIVHEEYYNLQRLYETIYYKFLDAEEKLREKARKKEQQAKKQFKKDIKRLI